MATKTTPKPAAKPAAKTAKAKPAPQAKPGEQHPGQTAEHGRSHEQLGSQLEREKHVQPNSNIWHAGSARSNKRPRLKGSRAQRKAARAKGAK
jgi:hypothetical protein